ncbi:MAG: hypothetical protein NT018_02570 [Armatimonadetes bacterium]|nr:hypothetical protein [Armatimonadota bacterium]
MTFFLATLAFMFLGRKLGWALSRNILYTAPIILTVALALSWGIGVGLVIHRLIICQEPNLILRLIMGYALGAYVAQPIMVCLMNRAFPIVLCRAM